MNILEAMEKLFEKLEILFRIYSPEISLILDEITKSLPGAVLHLDEHIQGYEILSLAN